MPTLIYYTTLLTVISAVFVQYAIPVHSEPFLAPMTSESIDNKLYQDSANGGICPDETWTLSPNKDRCFRSFKFNSELKKNRGSWMEALGRCAYYDASLATLQTPEEDHFASGMLNHNGDACWIGLKKYLRKKPYRGWIWVGTASPLIDGSYTRWGPELKLIWKILPPDEKCGDLSGAGWGARPCWGPNSKLSCFICATPSKDYSAKNVIEVEANDKHQPGDYHIDQSDLFIDESSLRGYHKVGEEKLLPYVWKLDETGSSAINPDLIRESQQFLANQNEIFYDTIHDSNKLEGYSNIRNNEEETISDYYAISENDNLLANSIQSLSNQQSDIFKVVSASINDDVSNSSKIEQSDFTKSANDHNYLNQDDYDNEEEELEPFELTNNASNTSNKNKIMINSIKEEISYPMNSFLDNKKEKNNDISLSSLDLSEPDSINDDSSTSSTEQADFLIIQNDKDKNYAAHINPIEKVNQYSQNIESNSTQETTILSGFMWGAIGLCITGSIMIVSLIICFIARIRRKENNKLKQIRANNNSDSQEHSNTEPQPTISPKIVGGKIPNCIDNNSNAITQTGENKEKISNLSSSNSGHSPLLKSNYSNVPKNIIQASNLYSNGSVSKCETMHNLIESAESNNFSGSGNNSQHNAKKATSKEVSKRNHNMTLLKKTDESDKLSEKSYDEIEDLLNRSIADVTSECSDAKSTTAVVGTADEYGISGDENNKNDFVIKAKYEGHCNYQVINA